MARYKRPSKLYLTRKANNLTILELAEKTGVSPGYISDLERGAKLNPSKKIMKKIAVALGEPVEELFF